jgi:hypothetical protein
MMEIRVTASSKISMPEGLFVDFCCLSQSFIMRRTSKRYSMHLAVVHSKELRKG